MYDDAFIWEITIERPKNYDEPRAIGTHGFWNVVGRLTGNNSGDVSQVLLFGENLTWEKAEKLQQEKDLEYNPPK